MEGSAAGSKTQCCSSGAEQTADKSHDQPQGTVTVVLSLYSFASASVFTLATKSTPCGSAKWQSWLICDVEKQCFVIRQQSVAKNLFTLEKKIREHRKNTTNWRVSLLDRNLLEANFIEMSAKYQISKHENLQVLKQT